MTTGCIDQPGFLRGSELRDLQARGHTIGTHSRNHPVRMSALPGSIIAEEWRTSLERLEERARAGRSPSGQSQAATTLARSAEAAAGNGITTLFTSEPEAGIHTVAGCTIIGRFTLRSGHPASYAGRLVGRAPFARGRPVARVERKKSRESNRGTALPAYSRSRPRVMTTRSTHRQAR
jgi:hypothetical protein